jgi:hypothetical protein
MLKCVIPVTDTGAACISAPIPLTNYLLTGTPRTCSAIRFNDLELPLGTFGSTLQIDATSKVVVQNVHAPCAADIVFEGQTTSQVALGLVELAMDNAHHLVLPARFELKHDCQATASCSIYPTSTGETINSCISSSNPTTGCGPVGNCGGPLCQSQNGTTWCCKQGERCGVTENTCTCGFGPGCLDNEICGTGGPQGGSACGSICCVPVECPQ